MMFSWNFSLKLPTYHLNSPSTAYKLIGEVCREIHNITSVLTKQTVEDFASNARCTLFQKAPLNVYIRHILKQTVNKKH